MKTSRILWILLTIIPILLLIIGYVMPGTFFSNQERMRTFVESYGTLAPVIFIGIQILQVVITPINHYAVGILGGYVFGLWEGFVYNYIGRVIGTLIAFYLARFIGRKIVAHAVSKKTMEKYDWIFERSKFLLFLMYFLPLFPDDELGYLAGISSMQPATFIPIMMLGHIMGSLSLAYLGNGVSIKDPLFIFLSLITLFGGMLFIVMYNRIHKRKMKA